MSSTEFFDTNYIDGAGRLHFLSALDLQRAVQFGLPFPDPTWTIATPQQVIDIQNPAPTQAQAILAIEAAVQDVLDKKAKERGYINADRCISYRTSSNNSWAADAAAMELYRDQCWAHAIAQEALSSPPNPEVVVAGLPTAPW